MARSILVAAVLLAATLALVSGKEEGLLGGLVANLLNTRTVIITLTTDTRSALASIDPTTCPTRTDLITKVVDVLQQNSLVSMAPVINLLNTVTGLVFDVLWISNQIFVKDCPSALITLILALPCVLSVDDELSILLPKPNMTADSTNNTQAAGWGQAKIGAPAVWSAGNTGQNTVVATIDSGVLYTHEALIGNYRGSYGWYDPISFAATPYDDNGHGTHTMGSLAGSKGIGVAPGAKWMACKGCSSTSCAQSKLLACAQFILCPTDTNGYNKDCSKAPHVVSNSWGGGRGLTYFQSAIDAWVAAGIIPVFAAGNSGPSCSSNVSPGDVVNAIEVGASDINDALGSFSSRGPSASGIIKPDISAPGVSIRSAWNTDNVTYKSYSGTSMASPQVAGTIALMLSANQNMTFSAVKAVLSSTAKTDNLPSSGGSCGGTSDYQFPNNQFGYGRVNAQAAVSAL